LRSYLVPTIAVALALVACAVGFVWAAPATVLRWSGYEAASERLVTGILVTGTSSRPIVYATSSDPRIARPLAGRDYPVDTNSGVVSQLSVGRDGWQRIDLVRGLPRSVADHATNGMALSPDGKTLYVAQGSNTNEGAPSEFFGGVPEYALSGAILSVDLARIDSDGYDLPTLDDPSRSGVEDENDPFGGNKGLNQARLVTGGPVQVFASGLRNPYDVVLTSAGRLYTIQNGPNKFGGPPIVEGPEGHCTSRPQEGGGDRGVDTLHLVEERGYYGHPNPTRGNPRASVDGEDLPVPAPRPLECDYVAPAARDALARFKSSTNGITEYVASDFAARLKGDLIAVALSGEVYRLELSDTGRQVVRHEVLTKLATPLDVTTQADDARFPGSIWVALYGPEGAPGSIAVLTPRARDGFASTVLQGAELENPTSLQFGPDGRLYVAQQDGLIKAFSISGRAGGDYRVTATEIIDSIQSIPNHDDDGSSATDFAAAMRVLWEKVGS
jgi:glucose/arabinose dehydrogenase